VLEIEFREVDRENVGDTELLQDLSDSGFWY
jgi:hypothetical protein